MRITGKCKYVAAFFLMAMLVACGGNHTAERSMVKAAENQSATNVPKYGVFVPKIEEVHRFSQNPSWGEDVMIQYVLLATPERYYLGDFRGIHILAVDMNGTLQHSFLKKGQGPGEFQWLSQVQKLGDDLWVYGTRKLDRLSKDGILRSEVRFEKYYYDFIMMNDSHFAGVRTEIEGDEKTGRRFKRAGLWDLKENRLKSYRTSDKRGVFEFKQDKMFLTLSFGGGLVPDLILSGDPDTQRIYVCETDIYRIYVMNKEGNLIQTIERTVEPAVLTDQDKDELAGNFNVNGMDQNDIRRRLKKQLPDRMCPVASLQVTPDGYLIVERPVKKEINELDMYSPTGEFLATFQNPKDVNLSRATFLSHNRFAVVDNKGDLPVLIEYRWVQPESK
ncbi:MAG: hypothetical protein DRJ08_05095 [Acidobacteria bacterium]|nr:MAG: hypothetical protein DRJ08_05095 [Acidobacteriota bacterium]